MKKILTVFYSWAGNTRTIAEHIRERVGGDLFEILPAEPYPRDYGAAVEQAKAEIAKGHRPALKKPSPDVGAYDVIFVGSPVWWGTMAPPVATFLAGCDLSGKAVVPFCSHGGGGQGRYSADIAKLCPRSTPTEALVFPGNALKDLPERLQKIRMVWE